MAGLYLHIPFCRQRCTYCDFYSTTREAECAAYVQILCREMHLRKEYLKGEPLDTIYIGGGTPSLLTETNIARLHASWQEHYTVSPDAEITLEANPDDLTLGYLHMLKRYSFNRISLGIQSFNDHTLKLLNRRHSSLQAQQAIAYCREAGFDNLSLDLIYGLPGEDYSLWTQNVEQALSLRPEHISAYLLTFEEDTRIFAQRKAGLVREMDEEEAVRCYSFLADRLKEAGYIHYEISNFALPERYSRHNSSYWKGTPYIGCGPSAHSYDVESRQWNTSDLTLYSEGILRDEPVYEREELDLPTRYNEYILTRLRTQWGISLEHIRRSYGTSFEKYTLTQSVPWVANGSLLRKEETLSLSEEGFFVSDAVISDLLYV